MPLIVFCFLALAPFVIVLVNAQCGLVPSIRKAMAEKPFLAIFAWAIKSLMSHSGRTVVVDCLNPFQARSVSLCENTQTMT